MKKEEKTVKQVIEEVNQFLNSGVDEKTSLGIIIYKRDDIKIDVYKMTKNLPNFEFLGVMSYIEMVEGQFMLNNTKNEEIN